MAHLFYQRPVRRKLLGQGCGGFRLHGEKLLETIDLLGLGFQVPILFRKFVPQMINL